MAAVTSPVCASDLSVSVIEKNTFISIVVEGDDNESMHAMKPRRNRSSPPSVKTLCSASETKPASEVHVSDVNTDDSTLDDSSDNHSSGGYHSWGDFDNEAQHVGSASSPDCSPAKRPSLADMLPDPPSDTSFRIAHMHYAQSLSPTKQRSGAAASGAAEHANWQSPSNSGSASPRSPETQCFSTATGFGVAQHANSQSPNNSGNATPMRQRFSPTAGFGVSQHAVPQWTHDSGGFSPVEQRMGSPTKMGLAPGNFSTSPHRLSLAASFGVPSEASPSKLNVSAKAFAPRGRGLSSVFNTPQAMQQHTPVPVPACIFTQRCASIIDVMRQQLFTTRDVTGVEVRMGDLCWSVAVQLHKDVLPDAVIEAAKEALLEGAQQSENLYVLGANASPIVQTPFGFTAILCEVANSNSACWDLLSTGCCRRGSRCQWEHPERRARVTVIIKRVSEV